GLAAAGWGVARGTTRVVRLGRQAGLASLAAPALATTISDGRVAVTVRNTRRTGLTLTASDFAVSAEGDIFGAHAWDGGTRTTIGPGRSHVFRVSFALPRSASKDAVLFYRAAPGEAPVTTALEGLPTPFQGTSSSSLSEPLANAVAPTNAFTATNAF